MKYLILLLALSLNTFAIEKDLLESIKSNIQRQVDGGMLAGAVVGLIDGDDVETFAVGYADIKTKVPLTINHYMGIGSVSKTFTSLLFSTAVVEGVVNENDTVAKFMPELKDVRAGSITLKELSTHSSYIQRDPVNIKNAGNPFEDFTIEDFINEIKNATYYKEDGNQNYSNLGASLLGICLERAYGSNYENILTEKVLLPLGLTKVVVNSKNKDILLPKKYSSSLREVPIWHNLGVMNSAGSLKMPIGEITKYLMAEIKASTQEIQNSQKTLKEYKDFDMAYGWFKYHRPIGTIFFHNGSTAGFATNAYFIPEINKGVVFIANSNSDVQCVFLNFITNDKKCDLKIPRIENYELIKEYAGSYNSSEGFIFHITASEIGFLSLRLEGQSSEVRLEKQDDGSYRGLDVNLKVNFIKTDKGHYLLFEQNNYKIAAVKIK